MAALTLLKDKKNSVANTGNTATGGTTAKAGKPNLPTLPSTTANTTSSKVSTTKPNLPPLPTVGGTKTEGQSGVSATAGKGNLTQAINPVNSMADTGTTVGSTVTAVKPAVTTPSVITTGGMQSTYTKDTSTPTVTAPTGTSQGTQATTPTVTQTKLPTTPTVSTPTGGSAPSTAAPTKITIPTSGTVQGSGTGENYGVTNHSDYLKELYDARLAANLAALEKAYKQNVNTLDAAADQIPEEYEAARNRAAASAAQEQRNFNQFASAHGLNSGTNAQAALAGGIALQNDLAAVNHAEASALAELDLQRAQLATGYENAIVQAQADGDYQLAEALYNESVRVDEAIRAQKNYLEELAIKREATSYNNGLELAQYLYQNTGDASGFGDYGYSDDQIAQLQAQWMQAQDASKDPEDGGVLTYEEALEALGNGAVSDEVLKVINDYYGLDEEPEAEPETGFSTERNVAGIKASEWDMVKQNIRTNLRLNNVDAVIQYLGIVGDQMNAAQQAEIDAMMDAYGY